VLNRLYRAFKHSWRGLRFAAASQWAIRVELLVLLIALPCAFIFAANTTECVLLVGSALLLLIVELINSAVEVTINRIGYEYNELSGQAKDLASAAVFVAIINALIVWIVILY
jgi:diacylglycerol kinase (ATP)